MQFVHACHAQRVGTNCMIAPGRSRIMQLLPASHAQRVSTSCMIGGG